ncbi:MAG: hypothetical protein HY796_03200 [Elusimicrobia bacterium]|nr:hypothetical protein [Elusimicrobiota bacterium]
MFGFTKPSNPGLRTLFLLFFIAQSAINLGNYTSLIYSAVAFSELSKPAFLILFQTIGSLGAFLLLNSAGTAAVKRISFTKLLLLNSAAAFLSSNVGGYYLWICFVMIRIVFATILISKLQAHLALVTKDREETQYYSKFMQSLYLFTFLVALTLSPLAQQAIGPSKVYLMDAGLMLLMLLIARATGFHKASDEGAVESPAAGLPRLSMKEALVFAPYIVWMWLVAGSFHVIEVPYLTNLVKLSSGQLTLVFLTAGIGAVLGSLFVPIQLISKHKQKTTFYAAAAISAFSLIYLKTVLLPGILLIVLFYGVSNGCFNVGVSNMIYDKIATDKHTAAFAFYRLLSNFSVIAAAIVMSSIGDIRHAFGGQVFLTILGTGIYLCLTMLQKKTGWSAE